MQCECKTSKQITLWYKINNVLCGINQLNLLLCGISQSFDVVSVYYV